MLDRARPHNFPSSFTKIEHGGRNKNAQNSKSIFKKEKKKPKLHVPLNITMCRPCYTI
jgi:hypothetical protein